MGDEGLDGVDCVECTELVAVYFEGLLVGELGFGEGLVGMTAVLLLEGLVMVGDLGIVVCTGVEVSEGVGADTSEQIRFRPYISSDLPSNGCATSEQTWTGTKVEEPAESVFQSPIQVTGALASSVVVTKGSVLSLTTVASCSMRSASISVALRGMRRTYFGTNVAEAPGVVGDEKNPISS